MLSNMLQVYMQTQIQNKKTVSTILSLILFQLLVNKFTVSLSLLCKKYSVFDPFDHPNTQIQLVGQVGMISYFNKKKDGLKVNFCIFVSFLCRV